MATSSRQDRAASRQSQVASLRRHGKSEREIAEEISCSKTTVHRDLEFLRRQWRERIAQDYDAHMADQFARFDTIYAKAWERYDASVTEKKPEGSPQLLEIARKAASEISNLIGLADPVEFQGKRVRDDDGTGASHVDIVEVVVSSRDELEEITDDKGHISLADYKRRLAESLKSAGKTG